MPPASGKAQVFADNDYRGASATLEEGLHNVGPATGSVKDDTVSSLKVADGYQVTLYADRDGKGASKTFTSDTPSLEGFNDTTSSVRVAGISDSDYIFSSENGDDWFYFEDNPPD